MSMISSLIDELRKSADEWNGSNMFELARMCSEAADTIWQLRDDLQRANAAVQDAEHDESVAWDMVRKAEAENAKLKQELEAVGTAAYLYGRNDLAAENAKLRELVRGLHMAYVGALNECESMDAGLIWDHCEMVDAELAKSHARFEVDRHRFDAAISELGVEVDR